MTMIPVTGMLPMAVVAMGWLFGKQAARQLIWLVCGDQEGKRKHVGDERLHWLNKAKGRRGQFGVAGCQRLSVLQKKI